MHVPLSPLFALQVGVLVGVLPGLEEMGGLDLVGLGAALVGFGVLAFSSGKQKASFSNGRL